MSKHDDYLKQESKICEDMISVAQFKTDEALMPYVETFQRNTLNDISQNFGDFLYAAMGDRVTGQRSSVINQKVLEANSDLVAKAKEANLGLEEYITQELKRYNKMDKWEKRYCRLGVAELQLWITAGRKFGVSYLTGDGSRTHTIYFGEGECFKYLTQEHVDCVKNKEKKACVQAFLNYRDDFVNGVRNMTENLEEVNIPVKMGIISCITKSPKINENANSYRDEYMKTYQIMDGIVDMNITHVMTIMHNYEVWDKYRKVHSYDAKQTETNNPSYISLVFLNIDDTKKTIATLGNVDISILKYKTSMMSADAVNSRNCIQHIDCIPDRPLAHIISTTPSLQRLGEYKTIHGVGVMLDMDSVLQNDQMKNVIESRISFYNGMSARLQDMKYAHASLYFVNADM